MILSSKIFCGILSPKGVPFKKLLILFSAGFSFLILISCSTTRNVAIVDRVHQDTIYLNKVQYDSIFINQYHAIDRGSDTIYVQDEKVEYRYKLLRDTVYRTRVDSIPVIRTVEVTKELRYTPWYAKTFAWIGVLSILLLILLILKKIYLK